MSTGIAKSKQITKEAIAIGFLIHVALQLFLPYSHSITKVSNSTYYRMIYDG